MPPTLRALLITALTLISSSDVAAQNIDLHDDLAHLRDATRISVGAGLLTGNIAFKANTFELEADLGQIPTTSFSMITWPERFAGIEFSYQTGFLGALDVPQLNAQSGDSALSLSSHRIEGAFVYRLFAGPRSDSLAAGVKLGFLLQNLSSNDHIPTILLDTTWAGPSLGPFLSLPFAQGDIGLDLSANIILPFFVRESPRRSGTPRDPLGLNFAIEPFFRLSRQLFLTLQIELHHFSSDFYSVGDRWYGDIRDASKDNTFLSSSLSIQWLL